jgi:hypothetical protein
MRKWKHKGRGYLIPETHDPGKQRGFMEGKKGGTNKSEHSSQTTGTVKFWIKMIDGVPYGSAAGRNMKPWISSVPLPKRQR